MTDEQLIQQYRWMLRLRDKAKRRRDQKQPGMKKDRVSQWVGALALILGRIENKLRERGIDPSKLPMEH